MVRSSSGVRNTTSLRLLQVIVVIIVIAIVVSSTCCRCLGEVSWLVPSLIFPGSSSCFLRNTLLAKGTRRPAQRTVILVSDDVVHDTLKGTGSASHRSVERRWLASIKRLSSRSREPTDHTRSGETGETDTQNICYQNQTSLFWSELDIEEVVKRGLPPGKCQNSEGGDGGDDGPTAHAEENESPSLITRVVRRRRVSRGS